MTQDIKTPNIAECDATGEQQAPLPAATPTSRKLPSPGGSNPNTMDTGRIRFGAGFRLVPTKGS